jgi:cytochrome c oxidase assembly factor CtaG
MTSSPWAFQAHPEAWATVGVLAAGYAVGVRRHGPATRRQALFTAAGLLSLLLALGWPLADLAAHSSLSALVVQRLLFLLAAPPLLIMGLPQGLTARLTRPAPVDWVLRRCARPAVAVAVVTTVAVATLTTAAVEAQGSSPWARAGLDVALVVAGFVLWTPILNELPGTDRPSAIGRAGYLVVQSIVPSFLAIVWIFARHPLYPHFAKAPDLFGVSPVTDQQIAGFVAKFTTIAVLWTVAFVSLGRAQQAVTSGRDPDPLLWSDVERHLERVERRERRRAWLPPSSRDMPPGDDATAPGPDRGAPER